MFDNNPGWEPAIQAITTLAVLTAGLVKPVVDAIKLAFPRLPSGAFPALAACTSIIMLLLLALSANTAITVQLVAQIVLAGLLSAVGAGGINRLHDKANDAQRKSGAATVVEPQRVADTLSEAPELARVSLNGGERRPERI